MSGNVTELSGNCLVPKREGRLRDFHVGKVAFLPMNPAKFRFTENHQSETKNIAS